MAAPSGASVAAELQAILCDLLLLTEDKVKPESFLVQDLQIDSLGFLDLAFAIEERFGVEFPDIKADREVLGLSLPVGLERIEALPGGATLFEFIKERVIRQAIERCATLGELATLLGVPPPRTGGDTALTRVCVGDVARLGVAVTADAAEPLVAALRDRGTSALGAAARERVFGRQTVADLAQAVAGPIPAGLDADAPTTDLQVGDLFRFVTVAVMARYIDQLREVAGA